MKLLNNINMGLVNKSLLGQMNSAWQRQTVSQSLKTHSRQITKASTDGQASNRTILVLGGTGFVGQAFISAAMRQGHRIVSLSRRGKPPQGEIQNSSNVEWIAGDATTPGLIQQLVDSRPDIDACFHCIGLLLDQESGLASLNKLASGSGSVPSLDASYDAITRKTALSAISALRSQSRRLRSERAALTDDLSTPLPPPPHPPLPFVFVSAAEAGWTFEAPVPFLERYLIAKRAVEAELLTPADAMGSAARSALDDSLLLRGVVLRPSLIWTWERPQALLSVLPFYVANALGLPFIDRPVLVQTLVAAALAAMDDRRQTPVNGVLRFKEMESLATTIPPT